MLLNNPEIYDVQFQMMKMLRIGTHNGTFHADEVLACALLKILPKYKVCKDIFERPFRISMTTNIQPFV